MASLKESKPKLLNTLDSLIVHMQGMKIYQMLKQAVLIAREVVAGCSIQQLANAVERAGKKLPRRG